MIKKKVFEEYGFFDEELKVCEDYDMWIRITAKEEVDIYLNHWLLNMEDMKINYLKNIGEWIDLELNHLKKILMIIGF